MPSELRLVKKLELAELTDEDVMERCALGSETAFRALVQRYRSRIMNLVCRFINDRDRAEEISQEVFLRVYRNRERYRKSGKFSTWIFTIAVNLTKNEIRSRVRHKGTFSLDAMEEDSGGQGLAFPDLKPLPDEDLNASEIRRRVAEALEKIPARYREALAEDVRRRSRDPQERYSDVRAERSRHRFVGCAGEVRRATAVAALGRLC